MFGFWPKIAESVSGSRQELALDVTNCPACCPRGRSTPLTETASLPQSLSAAREQATRGPRLRLSRWLPFSRPLPALLVALGLVRFWAAPTSPVPKTRDLSQALAETLAISDLRLRPSEAHWLEPGAASAPFDLREPGVVFRASQGDGPADIYKASVRLSPEGR